MDLPGCSCDRIESGSGSQKWTFRVHHQLRSTEVFAAESEKEMLEWIEAIRQVIVFMALKQEGGSQIQINELVRSASTSSGLVQSLSHYSDKHIVLRTAQSKYLSYMPSEGKLWLDPNLTINAIFKVEPQVSETTSSTVFLLHSSGKYLGVNSEDGQTAMMGIRTNLPKLGWEWSHTLGKNTIALRSLLSGKLLSCEKNVIKADKEQARTHEKWEVEKVENLTFVRSLLGTYISSRPNSGTIYGLSQVQSYSVCWFVEFQPEKRFTIRSHQGLYLARNTPSLATEKELLIAREAPYSWQYEEGQNSKLVPCYIISTSEGEKKYLSINLQGDVWLSPNRPSFTAPAISESQLWLLASVRQNELLTLSQLEVRVEQAAGKDMATFLNMVLQKFVTLPTRSSFLSGDTLFV